MRLSLTYSAVTMLSLAVLFAGPTAQAAAETSVQAGESAATAPAGTVDAVWVEQELAFTYMAFTTFYSCNGIRDKVRRILREIGVRPGFKVRASACIKQYGPERMPRVTIKAALPQALTPELQQTLDGDQSRRELVARVQGQETAESEAGEVFKARWQRVVLEQSYDSAVKDGDCELMRELVKHVFGPLGVQVADGSRLDCVPKQVPLYSVKLVLDVLQPVPSAQPASGAD
jgi:hypothetical protein